MSSEIPCILIVDDDASVRESLGKVLIETGYSVVSAADGREGLARLKHQGIDLVLLDLNLPKLSGFDILDVTRERCPLLPVIVLTGLIDQCEPGSLTGADALLEKPPDVALLLQTVKQLLSEPADQRLQRLSSAAAHVSSAPGHRLLPAAPLASRSVRSAATGSVARIRSGGLPCAW